MKNGAPIGDCEERDADALTASGCPATQPATFTPCSAPGKACRYEIRAESGLASQVVFSCSRNGNWGVGFIEQCGVTCDQSGASYATELELPTTNCAQRPATSCEDPATMYAAPPSAYTVASAKLQALLAACGADIIDNPVELELEGGCPARLRLQRTLAPAASACLRAELEQARWSCGELVPCISFIVGLTSG